MIIIGTYPDAFEKVSLSENRLSILYNTLSWILPQNLCLHIFPFYPNSGDFGFAPDDWFQIREDLGKWEDISRLAKKWKVIVDGIYNHVGINHEWVKNFNNNKKDYEQLLHVYKDCSIEDGPNSPRGQPVLVEAGSNYYFWKTFSEVAVDIRLECETVQKEISKHLELLSSIGVWGVRLDAVAYYSKFLGSQIRHNAGVYKITNQMADKIQSHNLKTLAQLDCDEDGLCYFSDEVRKNIPINDFTYSAYLALSILEENPEILLNHIKNTNKADRVIVRMPRTHDGILLRSKLLKKIDKEKILKFAESKKIGVRVVNEDPYELNCSAPYLYSLVNEGVEVSKTILFTMAVTGMMTGWSYFYLPYILGHTPELKHRQDDFIDPRAINRLRIDNNILEEYLKSDISSQIYSLLNTLNKIHLSQGEQFKTDCSVDSQLLMAKTVDENFFLTANFNKLKRRTIPKEYLKGEVIEKNGLNNGSLDGFGFVIMSLT